MVMASAMIRTNMPRASRREAAPTPRSVLSHRCPIEGVDPYVLFMPLRFVEPRADENRWPHVIPWFGSRPVSFTDSLSPRYVALATVAALLHRKRTGQGQYIDVSQIETGVYSLSEVGVRYSARGEVLERRGNHCEYAAPHAIYPCRGDDRWVAIAVFSDEEWRALCQVMGEPAWASEDRFATLEARLAQQEELDARIAAWTRDFEPHELMAKLQAAGVEAGAVQNHADLQHDPQLAHRGHFQEREHVHLGTVRLENYGIRLSQSPPRISSPGPNLGEHNDYILGELLGYSPEEIEGMTEREIIV